MCVSVQATYSQMEDMCYGIRRAAACVAESDHHALMHAGEGGPHFGASCLGRERKTERKGKRNRGGKKRDSKRTEMRGRKRELKKNERGRERERACECERQSERESVCVCAHIPRSTASVGTLTLNQVGLLFLSLNTVCTPTISRTYVQKKSVSLQRSTYYMYTGISITHTYLATIVNHLAAAAR